MSADEFTDPQRSHVPRTTRRFREGPRPVGQGMDRVLKHLNAPTAEVVQSVFTDWTRLVGEVIGEHTRPAKIENGTLFLEVDNAAWASEMEWMSEDILRRVSERADTVEINRIKVVIAR